MNKPHLLIALLAGASVAAAAWAQQPAADAALREARVLMLVARTGNAEAAAKGVAVLEQAVAASPDNAPLWAALGNAYITTASLAMGPGGNPANVMAGFRKAPEAYNKALKLDPNDVDALSGHGTMLTAAANFQKKPELADQGMVEMTRAIELAPTRTAPRLNRAFSGVNTPPAKRDVPTIVEDLTFLAKVAGQRQSGDYIRLLLGDLYYETGKPDLARAQYEAAARPGAKAEAEARARLAALPGRTIPEAEIRKIRSATGTNCAMCHGG